MSATDNFGTEFRTRGTRSTPGLVADLFGQATSLFGKEVELVRTELSEKLTQGVTGIAFMVGGAVFLIGAINVLLAAIVAFLIQLGTPPALASLIVAAVVGGVGWLLVSKGLGALKTSNLAPHRSAGQLKRDAALVREQVK